MKLSDIKGEHALDVLADLIEPACEIMADEKVKKAAMKQNKAAAIKVAIKGHKKAIIEILATLEGVPVKDYNVNLFTLPMKLLELLNDPAMQQLFTFQGQTGDAISSGSASEKTEN